MQDYVWLKSFLMNLEMKSRSRSDARSKGTAFGFTCPLCHNDLSASNLLLLNEGQRDSGGTGIVLIDYEYGSYNYRAFDIAHHFDGKCDGPLLY